eukprot:TRINITY_DN28126_c0_g1_i2.p1 TRINITY_DN28126_c0_g1~~TRINITY_DN28126_c0_g1_i2.p1  ORF type:complete len:325 (-),score=97.69 TRINITY_DN28126_c0_g1_i2:494-1468(-)
MENKSRGGDKRSKGVHIKSKKKRKLRETEENDDPQKFDLISSEHDRDHIRFATKIKLNKADKEKNRSKSLVRKKRKKEKETEVHLDAVDELSNRDDGGSPEKLKSDTVLHNGDGKESSQSEAQTKIKNSIRSKEVLVGTNTTINKSEKAGKSKKKHRPTSKKAGKSLECRTEVVKSEDVYHLSSGDDDCSKGMKKWLTEYHCSRPGLEILQQRIDDFIIAHEAQEEQAIKEKEALAAEEGWTVVMRKGNKRTTDLESGISVGSVAQAAVMDKMEKKKKKAIALDFYNFQRREAQRNEIMMLQSKFEQDKKRIQQMRAARKFRPY